MQAAVMHETGDPRVLRLEQAERPEPGDGEVLIRVHAPSVNPMSPNGDQLARVAQLVAAGGVRVEIAETLPLAEVRRAHELSESGIPGGRSSSR